jgi:anaerobic selenocysteine-containing dehydrogenase
MPDTVTRLHVCPLCEAGCGLAVEMDGARVVSVRGDDADVLSAGYLCPKGVAMPELEHDPDRLRTPMRRDAAGAFHPVSWEEAFELAGEKLNRIRRDHGRDAIAVYMGTVVIHKHSTVLMRNALLGALRTRNSTSAGSQDVTPRFAASRLLYGSSFSLPVPDLDRTDYFLCLGANPWVSNGSVLTAPNIRARIRAIRDRGGKVVVVDPRRTETAKAASEHVSIKPGGDAALLLAMVQTLLQAGRVDQCRLADETRGWSQLLPLLESFTPERVEGIAGVEAATIRRLAFEFADARTGVAYSRIGVCNNEFGTLASYATDLLNLVAGRLGAEGGSMFPTPAVDLVQLARLTGADGFGRWRSRVRGLPEVAGDIPASTLAEEMETEGPGQIRALVLFAGNPVLTVPNGPRLQKAIEKLDFVVAIDMYINETTRHADLILPPAPTLSEDHVDFFFANVAARNIIRWSPPVQPRADDERCDWEIMLELAFRLGGGPTGLRPLDALFRLARRFGYRFTPDFTMDMALRLGPYGDCLLPWGRGLNGRKVRAAPHGIDLGPLQPGFRHRIFHRHRRVDLAPAPIVDALAGLQQRLLDHDAQDALLLIGRRDLRSNNSWMHNLPMLMGGHERCVLFVHPDDAARAGIVDGGIAIMQSKVHRGTVPVRVTDEVRPGVVSLPHGWGHRASAATQRVAGAHAGVSANDWTDDQYVEAVVGQSILNGVPVWLSADATA